MNHEQANSPNPPAQTRNTLNGSPIPPSTRQRARSKGLAWVSAITLGAGAASTVGAVALATTLHSAAATSASAATSAGSATQSKTSTSGTAPQLQSAKAPTTTSNPPAATSGAS
jgi:hypothetical protein